jgi:SAM-dependent methyltransferase
MRVIEDFFPSWRASTVHESSPSERGASVRLARECSSYIPSQYLPHVPWGTSVNGVVSQNLEALTFADNSVDLHITQDVFEHIFDPEAAFREIGRTLRPGGAHIFTTPLTEKANPSQRCSSLRDGKIIHHLPPEYHGNPVSNEGSLVTMHWGYDICETIFKASGLFTEIVHLDLIHFGIRADLIEVLVSRKPKTVTPR